MGKLIFGLDIGISSCGWAVLEMPCDEQPGQVLGLGSWMFDVPETGEKRTPTNQIRRQNRLARRTIRRRNQRIHRINALFRAALPPTTEPCLHHDVWSLRAYALDNVIAPEELAAVLKHIAKRRGFKSSKKTKTTTESESNDDKAVLSTLAETKKRLLQYRTVGEMFHKNPLYAHRKRNRNGVYDRTQQRENLVQEVHAIFEAQRRLGSPYATESLESSFIDIAFFQRDVQDSELNVGYCQFETREKRAGKFTPSFEKFRFLTKLSTLSIVSPTGKRPLSSDERALILSDLGKTAKVTYASLRKRLSLKTDETFSYIQSDDEKQDVAVRTGESMHGTRKLRLALGDDVWHSLSVKQRDDIAQVICFFETETSIRRELKKLSFSDAVTNAIIENLGSFASFKGAGHISLKAARAMLPFLEDGMRYDEACSAIGYTHSLSASDMRPQVTNKESFNTHVKETCDNILNPIAKKSVAETLKQIWAMINEWGLPDAIHVEVARDVGKSLRERNEIEASIRKTTKEREKERQEVKALLGLDHVSAETLLRYRLWKEQGGYCLYSGIKIPVSALNETDNHYQIDHILPWSRFGDDSYKNKTLSTTESNYRKKARTPFEWIKLSQAPWDAFETRVKKNKNISGIKKRNYLLKDAKDVEGDFRSRNLNDTRYASKIILSAAEAFYPVSERAAIKGGKRHVYARPGALTSLLRRAWGIESLKKKDGQRVHDDRHHALDALIVAMTTEHELHRLTALYQEWENKGFNNLFKHIPTPWGDRNQFKEDMKAIYETACVARPEKHRARGEGHAAKIHQLRYDEDKTPLVYERKSIENLKESDIVNIKDSERNGPMIKALKRWIKAGRPMDNLPCHPNGTVISKVRIRIKNKPGVLVRGGTAGRGSMVRLDIFQKKNKKQVNQFYLVPIYTHHVMNKKGYKKPPLEYITSAKGHGPHLIDDSFEFVVSLRLRTFIEIVKNTGEVIQGYYLGANRASGSIAIASPHSLKTSPDGDEKVASFGVKNLHAIKKIAMGRLGERHDIVKQTRTWHGQVV